MLLRKRDILLKAKNDDDFMNELLKTDEVEHFIKYVIKAYTKNPARFMQFHRVEWEDLYQASLIGLFNGIKRLDLDKVENEWVRYLFLSIQGEIRNFSRSNASNSISISQRIRALYPQYLCFYDDYRLKFSKDPSIDDTMKQFQISRDDAFDLVYGMQQVISIFLESGGRDLEVEREGVSRNSYEQVEKMVVNKLLVESYLSCLNQKQRISLLMYYYLGYSKTEIAHVIGCANSMVHKYIESAFKMIRKMNQTGG